MPRGTARHCARSDAEAGADLVLASLAEFPVRYAGLGV